MRVVKSICLGSAAGLVAIACAQAADLPVKAKPVEYVKVCSLYGAGFYYIPGTDTCIKIGGYVRFEAYHNSIGAHAPFLFANSQASFTRATDTFAMRARGMLTADARSQTEYGTLRGYVRFGIQTTTAPSQAAGNPAIPAPAVAAEARYFIQFAGFTFGLTNSFFDFYNGAAYGFTPQFANSAVGPAGIVAAAYTAQFGNGVSASISLEDWSTRQKSLIDLNSVSAFPGFAPTGTDSSGSKVPDIVGNIRVDQAWGSAQVMGALHLVSARYYTNGGTLLGLNCVGANDACEGFPSDKWGWAVGAGMTLKMPWDPKDTLSFQVAYSEGATAYAGQGLTSVLLVKHGTVAGIPVNDAVFVDPRGSLILTEAWSVTASFEHYWTPTLRTAITGQWIEIDYQPAANALLCNSFGQLRATFGGTTNCANEGGTVWQIAQRTMWNPVANLDIGLEVAYTKVEPNITGATAALTFGNTSLSNTSYVWGDVDVWHATLRVQRNFWP